MHELWAYFVLWKISNIYGHYGTIVLLHINGDDAFHVSADVPLSTSFWSLTNVCIFKYPLQRNAVYSNSGKASQGGAVLWKSTRIHQLCLYAPCLPDTRVMGKCCLAYTELTNVVRPHAQCSLPPHGRQQIIGLHNRVFYAPFSVKWHEVLLTYSCFAL